MSTIAEAVATTEMAGGAMGWSKRSVRLALAVAIMLSRGLGQ